ncbi:MAG: SixA phosphatase family protein [Flavobacteriales bacterium]
MLLHLLRHAKTQQNSPTGKDFDRELLPRGYAQIEELKKFYEVNPIAPKYILCSSAKRTRQTLAELQDFWPMAQIIFLDKLYLASKQDLLAQICALQTPDEILVIGHNEGLSELAIYLTDQALWLKTCGCLSLDLPFDTSAYFSANTGNVRAKFRVV